MRARYGGDPARRCGGLETDTRTGQRRSPTATPAWRSDLRRAVDRESLEGYPLWEFFLNVRQPDAGPSRTA